MVHFLDSCPFDFSLPAAQDLHELLWTNIDSSGATRRILKSAGILPALVHMEQPLYLVWQDVLEVAAKQRKIHALLDAVRREPVSGPTLASRLEELSRANPPVRTAPPGSASAWHEEAITGDASTLLDVAFLALGAQRARSVVRLSVSFEDGAMSIGTGFFVRPDIVLSNHHVLFHEGRAATSVVARFDYERTPGGAPAVHFDREADASSIRGDVGVDAAFVRMEAPENRPFLPAAAGSAAAGDRVYIIQHPAGGPKKIGMVHNHVQHVDTTFLQYLTDTLPGSSGSPVFDEHWNVIALHHRSVTARSETGVDEIRNQGVRIDAVLAALSPLGLL